MVFNGEKIHNLLNGEEITCSECQKGQLKPHLPNVPLNKQVYFFCDNCKTKIYIHRKNNNKPKCLQ